MTMMENRSSPRCAILLGALLAVLVSMGACGGGGESPAPPTQPTPPTPPPSSSLNLRPGMQFITFTGLGLSQDPQLPPCTPLGVPATGTSVNTQVMLERSGAEWIARSPSNLGTLEIRLRDGTSSVLGEGVLGSVRGSAIDVGQGLRPPLDVRVELSGSDGSASLDGVVSRSTFLSQGRITGAIAFTDSQNARGSCTAVQWMMQPTWGVLPTTFALFARPPRPFPLWPAAH
jgi:hypothetical protein